MNVTVSWNEVAPSRWMENHINQEADKLARHLAGPCEVALRFAQDGLRHQTRIHVLALGRDWFATGEGDGDLEAMHDAFETVMRQIDEYKRLNMNRIHRKFRRRDKRIELPA